MPAREKKPLSWFKTNPQVRHTLTAIDEMAKSLKEHGQLQDLGALADGTLIWGHRRLAAARDAGMKEFWVQVFHETLDAVQITVLRAVENIQRENLSQQEIALICKDLVEGGLSQKQVAVQLGKNEPWASRYMSPWRCIQAWQDAFLSNAVSVADCAVAAQATEQEQHEMLAAKFGARVSADELRRRVQRARRPSSEVRRGSVKCPLPSGLTVTVTGNAFSLSEAADALLDAGKHIKKAIAEGLDAKTFEAVMKQKRKGGGNGLVS